MVVVVVVVPPIIVPPRVSSLKVMPKRVAARPATVESSAMSERCCTGQVRLKSEPRVIGPPPICQAGLDDFFATRPFASILHPPGDSRAIIKVEFSA